VAIWLQVVRDLDRKVKSKALQEEIMKKVQDTFHPEEPSAAI
jgi:hypothetical protein